MRGITQFSCAILLECFLVGQVLANSATGERLPKVSMKSMAKATAADDKDQATLAEAIAKTSIIAANNTIRITDSQITLTGRDQALLLKSIADAVIAGRMSSNPDPTVTDDTDDTGDKATLSDPRPGSKAAAVLPMPRDAFLYYVTDPKSRAMTVRMSWRYPLADWKLYSVLLAPTACEVKRTIGTYFYC
ncbi:hypothetical protein FI667_g16416, partial [Globisporangium splendens]